MTRRLLIPAALAALTMLGLGCSSDEGAGLAPVGAGTRKTCFLPTDIKHWSDTGGGNFVIRTDRDDFFTSRVAGDCIDINFADEIAIRPRFFGIQICEGDPATLITRDIGGRNNRRCEAFAFRKLTPEQVAALPPKALQ